MSVFGFNFELPELGPWVNSNGGVDPEKKRAGGGPDVFFQEKMRKNTVFYSVVCTSRGWERGVKHHFSLSAPLGIKDGQ